MSGVAQRRSSNTRPARKNLPGSDGDGTGYASTVVGFDACQIGGTYVEDGLKHAVTQKTVVIPAPDGVFVFVLQLNADGTEDQTGVLMDATTSSTSRSPLHPRRDSTRSD